MRIEDLELDVVFGGVVSSYKINEGETIIGRDYDNFTVDIPI